MTPGLESHLTLIPANSRDYADRMYAIAFDLDMDSLKKTYGKPHANHAYNDIKVILVEHGFTWTQGSVYFGDEKLVNAVSAVIAVQDVAKRLPWFSASVRDIRMLRIEENNDLKPAINAVPASPSTGSLFDVAKSDAA